MEKAWIERGPQFAALTDIITKAWSEKNHQGIQNTQRFEKRKPAG